jgi:hypothetical protein
VLRTAPPDSPPPQAWTPRSQVWEVVDANYLDARATGWDQARWAELRDAALTKRYAETAAVHRSVMVACSSLLLACWLVEWLPLHCGTTNGPGLVGGDQLFSSVLWYPSG